jgi:hypothetical protein
MRRIVQRKPYLIPEGDDMDLVFVGATILFFALSWRLLLSLQKLQ